MAEKKIVLITGANTGIGFEAVKSLLRSEHQYHVLLAGRSPEKVQQATHDASSNVPSSSTVKPVIVDVESDESIQRLYEQVAARHGRIDCLVNNAGAAFDTPFYTDQMTVREAWNKTWDVNVTGAHIMTLTFLPLLLKSQDPRLLFITSGASSLEGAADAYAAVKPGPPDGLPKKSSFVGYRASKAGLNMLMIQWATSLKNDGVKVWSLAPGFLATSLGGDPEELKTRGAKDPNLGGDAIRAVIEGKRDADSGKSIREYGTPVMPW